MPDRCRTLMMSVVMLLAVVPRAGGADVVIVRTSDAEPYALADAALRQFLSEQKYNVKSLLARDASNQGVSASIGKPDVVVAVGTAAAKWLHKQLPGDVKLAYCMVSNPAQATLLQGHACAGVTTDVPITEQLKLVAEALPRARTIGLMYRADTAEGKSALADLQRALPEGWRIEPVAVNDFPSVAAAIDAMMQKSIDIAWTTPDQTLYDTACVRSLLLAGVRSKVPVWGYCMPLVRAGALLGVGVDPASQGQQAAQLVITTIRDHGSFTSHSTGPDRFQVGVNLIVAEQIGVEIPESVKHEASFVYQPEK